jgi:cation-transporting ATPase 13A3/4/5
MENKLKPATSDTIATLNKCNIRTIMATGDNTLTAISVARQCKILEQYQDVYFGDIVNERLVWKSQAGRDDPEDIT